MEKEKTVKDVDFADSAVPASARKNVVTMFMMKNMKSTKTMRKKRKNQEVLSPSLRRKSLK